MSNEGFWFRHRLEVRFSDCDAMGHVNHAVYFTYFEQCRFALWRRMGGGTGLPGSGTILVHAECDYRAPAFINDSLEVSLRIGDLGRSSFTFHYAIANAGTGQRLADGKTVNVTFDYPAGRTIPIPDVTRQLLEQARTERWS
jgi:acyl-CoA thioester hydrolase